MTLPLLAVNLLAFYHEITLPDNMAWLGTQPTLIILSVACAAETIIHFIPVAGTYLKAMATPLAAKANQPAKRPVTNPMRAPAPMVIQAGFCLRA